MTITELLERLQPYFDNDGGSASEVNYLNAAEAPNRIAINIANGEFRADTPERWVIGLGGYPFQTTVEVAHAYVTEESPDRIERLELGSTTAWDYVRPIV